MDVDTKKIINLDIKREKKFLNSGGKMIFPLPTVKIH